MTFHLNPRARADPDQRGLFTASQYDEVSAFFARRRDLLPTPLRRLPALGAELGIHDLLVKDETSRFGLNAFKVVGVQFAVDRLLQGFHGERPTLACASTGNHGRAVARVARDRGLAATIYVPAYTSTQRLAAIASEGAELVVFEGSYDDAVKAVAIEAERSGWQIVSDTGWPGYEEIPGWIMLGYTRIFEEAAAQWAPEPPPDVVIVQAGVGGLAAAAASWFAFSDGAKRPFMIAAEPERAACLLESARAGQRVTLTGPLETIMAGLRSGEVSTAAWPAIAGAIDAFVAIEDGLARSAIADFGRARGEDPPIQAGPSGACGLAVLRKTLADPVLSRVREAARLGLSSRALLVVTEGQ